MEQRLKRAQQQQLRLRQARLLQLKQRVLDHSPQYRVRAAISALPPARARMRQAVLARLQQRQRQLARAGDLLHSLSPLATLERGYSILRKPDGAIVRRSAQVSSGDRLEARVASGSLLLTVETTSPVEDSDS